MNTFFPLKQVKIIIGICVILAAGMIVIFPKLHKPSAILERNTYCDGFAAEAHKNDPTIDLKISYNDCINHYVKS